MNITDVDGKWKLADGGITNRKTNEYRRLAQMPSANVIAFMNYNTFMRKCQVAFDTGSWPKTSWKSGRVTD